MNWAEQYRQKLTSADQALEVVRSGYHVYVHPGCAAPMTLSRTPSSAAPTCSIFGKADYTLPQFDGRFRHNGQC